MSKVDGQEHLYKVLAELPDKQRTIMAFFVLYDPATYTLRCLGRASRSDPNGPVTVKCDTCSLWCGHSFAVLAFDEKIRKISNWVCVSAFVSGS